MHLFSGEDTFASYKAARAEVDRLAEGSELVIIDGDELGDINELTQHTSGLSLFGQPTVVFLKRPFENSELTKYLTAELDSLADKDLVLWQDRKADGRLGMIKTLDKRGLHTSFVLGKPRDIENWFRAELRSREVKLDPVQQRFVLQRIGQDKWQLSSLLDKLSLVKGQLTEQDLFSLVGSEASGDIWRFLDSLGARNKSQVLDELEKLTRFEDNTQYIIAMLTRELGLMAKVLDIQESKGNLSSLKLHPFVLEKAVSKALMFDWKKLNKLYQALFRLDLAIKQGRLDPLTGLTMFVLSW